MEESSQIPEQIQGLFDNDNDPRPVMVTVKCTAYNHERYIRDALDGFVMQQTNFRFEVLVHDDASTDNTASIIREYAEKYPNIIIPIYEKENQYSKGKGDVPRIMNAAIRGKYVAICEGDDYWTDPLKLQKQIDFLESNPEYGMCYTQVRNYIQENKRYAEIWGGPFEMFEEYVFSKNTIPTLSVVYKSKLYREYLIEIQPQNKGWLMGDFPLWLYISIKSRIKFLPILSGVYRVLVNSASHSNNINKKIKFVLSYRDIENFFCITYGNNKIKKKALQNDRWVAFIKSLFFESNRSTRLNALKFLFKSQPTIAKKMSFVWALINPQGFKKYYIKHFFNNRIQNPNE